VSAVILAGGLGTRLRSEVADRPKVLAEVAGHPFLLYLLEPLQRAGLRHVVLCTGHGAAQLAEVLGDRRGLLAIDHSVEDHPLGTGGALRHALPLLPSQTWLVMNGDSFAGLDPAALIAHHRAQGRAATLAVVHRPDTSRFGRVRLGEADRVPRGRAPARASTSAAPRKLWGVPMSTKGPGARKADRPSSTRRGRTSRSRETARSAAMAATVAREST